MVPAFPGVARLSYVSRSRIARRCVLDHRDQASKPNPALRVAHLDLLPGIGPLDVDVWFVPSLAQLVCVELSIHCALESRLGKATGVIQDAGDVKNAWRGSGVCPSGDARHLQKQYKSPVWRKRMANRAGLSAIRSSAPLSRCGSSSGGVCRLFERTCREQGEKLLRRLHDDVLNPIRFSASEGLRGTLFWRLGCSMYHEKPTE